MHGLLLFAAATLALVGAAVARPLKGSDANAPVSIVFRRSCADCNPEHFCDFAYPGAPLNTVACVGALDTRALYKRYDTGPNPLCEATEYPGSRQCNAGVDSWIACDWATGLPLAEGTESSTGSCNMGCCLPRAQMDSWCNVMKVCVVDGKTTEMAVFTSGDPPACDTSTGVVGSGSGNCGLAGPGGVGNIGGCCREA
ncbi:hypothetical protein DFJ74DRAFT_57638 [Hyaloraphidium curvatum]|nr:hypothetical protein DFJ74DRAFT_57638 [Hyaloraphidium curvatum]